MAGTCVIYGATGFTGQQLVDEALNRGLSPILAGRSRSKLEAIARRYGNPSGLQIHATPLDQPWDLDALLDDATVVLNAAGPYFRTAMPMVEACLRTGTHYLDVSGELPSVERIAARHDEAVARDVMLMPAVGYAVVPSDCLAFRASRQIPNASRLRIALSHFDLFAAGSAKSMVSLVQDQVRVRRNGEMTNVPVGQLECDFDFGFGLSRSTAINWCDSFSAYFATGIPNIEVYLEAGPMERWLYSASSRASGWIRQPVFQALLGTGADWWFSRNDFAGLPQALTGRQRCVVVEATDDDGSGIQLRLTSPEPYRVTRECAIAIVERVLNGDSRPGFQTPAGVYGDVLLQQISSSRIERRAIQQ